MIFDDSKASYVLAVLRAVDKLGGDAATALDLTDRCDECGRDVDAFDPEDPHAIGSLPANRPYVIIGCEGYWHIDPNIVGIDSPNWQPPRRES